MNDSALERRALAAAAEARAKAEAYEREEKRRREEEERLRRAKEDRAAKRGAVRRLKEVLGHHTSPSDWGIWRGSTYGQGRYGGRWATVTFATLKLRGVDVRGNENYLEVYSSPGSTDFRDAGWHELTLVSFGYVLERRPPPGSFPVAMDDPLTRHRAGQVAHSLNVIAELPQYAEDTAFPVGLRVAAVDAFFIHLRLPIEFLIKKPDPRHPAIHRDDYANGFNLGSVDSALHLRLDAGYDFASQHVAHFSLERLPAGESAGVEYVSTAGLYAYAGDVFGAMRAFIRHMRTTESAYADDFDQWLSAAEARRP